MVTGWKKNVIYREIIRILKLEFSTDYGSEKMIE